MKRIFLFVYCVIATTSILTTACNNSKNPTASVVEISPDSLINRGKYLVTIMDCAACHTPKKMGPAGPEYDMDRFLSGHPADAPSPKVDTTMSGKGWILFDMGTTTFVGPWGQSFAANITSDETGIGGWTEEQFFTALRKGKWKGINESRPLMPPMPWQTFSQLKDEDIRAIFAFLKTTKAVSNRVPALKPWNELK